MRFSEAAASQTRVHFCFTPCVLSTCIKAVALCWLLFIWLSFLRLISPVSRLPRPIVHFHSGAIASCYSTMHLLSSVCLSFSSLSDTHTHLHSSAHCEFCLPVFVPIIYRLAERIESPLGTDLFEFQTMIRDSLMHKQTTYSPFNLVSF